MDLLFIFLSCCCLSIWTVHAEYGAFLVTNDRVNEAACVLTGEATRSAVAWTSSAHNPTKGYLEQNINNKSTYDPAIVGSQFDCSFEDSCISKWKNVKNIWQDDVSFKYPFNPRTDSAWNDFKLLYSEGSKFGEIPPRNKFKLTLNNVNQSYISISVKVAKDAHVVFCDGYEFLSSQCYMVILAGFTDGTMSVIRKCVEGMPIEFADKESCKLFRKNVTHGQPLVDERQWRHFTFFIKRTNTMTEIKLLADIPGESNYKPILEYQDTEIDHIQIKYVGVKSYIENAQWKIHNYQFLKPGALKQSGISYFGTGNQYNFEHNKNYLCLKMAVALCATCSFQLHVEDEQGRRTDSKVIRGKDRNVSYGLTTWREETFNISLHNSRRNLKLRFTTTVEDEITDPFWAIDDVTECSTENIKTLKFHGDYRGETCQIIDEEVSGLVQNFNIKSVTGVNKFPNCSNLFSWTNSCEGIKISTVDYRRHECYPGHNGPYCTEKTVVSVEYNFLKSGYYNMILKPKMIKPNGTIADYMRIQFQYNCDCDAYNPWKNLNGLVSFSDYQKELMIPSDVGEKYLLLGQDLTVRAILYIDGFKEFKDVAGNKFKPTCVHNDKYLKFTPMENNITISVNNMETIRRLNICPLSYYTVEIRKPLRKSEYHNRSNLHIIKDLKPYVDYIIYLTRNEMEFFNRTVTTADAAPGQVQKLVVYSKESDSLSLRWKPPTDVRGILQNYTIRYYNNRNTNLHITTNGYACPLWDSYICQTIDKLTDSYYTIEVYAHTRNPAPGKTNQLHRVAVGQGNSSEPLDLQKIHKNTTEISWRHPWIPNGKIEYFEIDWKLKSTNLRNEPKKTPTEKILDIKNPMQEYTYVLKDLAPASVYSVKVTAHNKNKGTPAEIEIATPLVPPRVDGELQVQKLSHNQIQITIPAASANVTKKSGFYIVVSETKPKVSVEEKKQIQNVHKKRYAEIWKEAMVVENKTVSWIAKYVNEITEQQETLPHQIIGTNKVNEDDYIWDGPLSDESTYTIAVVYYNELNDMRTYTTLFNNKIVDMETNYALWSLLLLFLIIPIVFLAYKKYKARSEGASENHFRTKESIPLTSIPAVQVMNDLRESTRKSVMNIFKTQDKSHPVDIADFENYVKESLRNGELEKQHKMFKRGMQYPHAHGLRKENKTKNRYMNLIAYDTSRVILEKLPGDLNSDYINANYIDGYECPKEYIATQGPKEQTTNDFWRMVWQEKVTVICMLTNTKEGDKIKCHQYWPLLEGAEVKYGQITVHHDSTMVYADFMHRSFNVTFGKKNRLVQHLHFTSWPDHGVPQYARSVVTFIQKFQSVQTTGPNLIHCSAGVGRTGTIIIADICLKMARDVHKIDVLHCQKLIRDQRANLVDNKDQYKLVHMILVESLCGEATSIPCGELKSKVNEMRIDNTLLDKWRNLDKHSWKDNFTKITDDETIVEEADIKENRNDIVPGAKNRVFISRFPVHDEHSDYINAVYVDGFRVKDQFIVTQFPLPHTIADYWRMISDKDITLVTVLNEIDTTDKTVEGFIPNKLVRKISPISEISVHYLNARETAFCNIIDVVLNDKTKPGDIISRNIKVVQLKKWPSNEVLPSWADRNAECLIILWEQLEKIISGPEPVLITCYDGATGCGLFTALTFVIEKIKLEHECDVPLAVRIVRRHRKEMIRSKEQYNFLYDAAICYLEGFDLYSNFS